MDKHSTIAEQAAEWVAALEVSGAKKQVEFQAWLRQSAHHVEEYLLASAIYRELDGIDPRREQDLHALMAQEVRNVVPLVEQFRGNVARVRSVKWQIAGVAAALALVLVGAFWTLKMSPRNYATAVGEQRVFELADGSVVYLNAHTRIEVDLSSQGRDIQLADGEALFKVAHDPSRPFRVHVGEAVIQAIGTEFNVYRRASSATVSVVEGAVRVSAIELHAGEEAQVTMDGKVSKAVHADAAKAVAWRQRRLIFKDERLADIAAEFNRYNKLPQIRVDGETLNDRRLTGVFDADAPESLIRFLEGAHGIFIGREGSDVVISNRRNE